MRMRVLGLLQLLSVSCQSVLPVGWTYAGPAPAGTVQRIHLALKQRGVSTLQRMVEERSDPNHASFGRWLTSSEVESIVSPGASAFRRVEKWAYDCGAHMNQLTRIGGDAIALETSVETLECMFSATGALHQVHDGSGKLVVRSLGPLHVPEGVAAVLEMHTPLASWFAAGRRRRRKSRLSDRSESHVGVVPQTLSSIYGGAMAAVSSGSNATNAVAELQHALGPEGFDPADIDQWQQAMLLPHSVQPSAIFGGHNDGFDPTGECTLDVDMIGGVAQGALTTFWMNPEWIYELALSLSNASAPQVDVLSISWGYTETRQCGPTDFGPDMPANCTAIGGVDNVTYVQRANTELMKLAARGISVIASSGDAGAPGEVNVDCTLDATPAKALNPDFPAASPWVLSVGATMLDSPPLLDPKASTTPEPCRKRLFSKALPCARGGTETVASTAGGARITSGGGFSRLSPQPKWQAAAVANYLRNAESNGRSLPPPSSFNASNRAYPDVAALGKDFLIYEKGSGSKGWMFVDGTSVAAPVWAGMVTLLNDARYAAGKTRLGHLPPILYGFASAKGESGFHDITEGDNKCTSEDGGCCKLGFEAADGWDPVTGLGTPKFDALKEYVLGLP